MSKFSDDFGYFSIKDFTDAADAEIDRLAREVNLARGDNATINNQNSVLMRSNGCLVEDKATLRGHITALEGKVTGHELWQITAEKDRSVLRGRINDQDRALRQAGQDIQIYRRQVHANRKEIDALRDEVVKLKARPRTDRTEADLRKYLHETMHERDEVLNTRTAERAAAKRKLELVENDAASVRRAYDMIKAREIKMMRELKVKRADLSNIQTQVKLATDRANTNQEAYLRTAEERSRLVDTVQGLRSDLQSAVKRGDTFKKQAYVSAWMTKPIPMGLVPMEPISMSPRSLIFQSNEVQLKKDLAEANAEINRLCGRIESIRTTYGRSTMENKIDKLNGDLSYYQRHLEGARQEVRDCKKRIGEQNDLINKGLGINKALTDSSAIFEMKLKEAHRFTAEVQLKLRAADERIANQREAIVKLQNAPPMYVCPDGRPVTVYHRLAAGWFQPFATKKPGYQS